MFGLVFFTMLLGALNYSNNMGFALAFLLTAVAVVSIHHCQRNLAGLRLTVSGCEPVFAGEPLECTLYVDEPGAADPAGRSRRVRPRSAHPRLICPGGGSRPR